MRSVFSVRALLFAIFLLAGLTSMSRAQAQFTVSGTVALEGFYGGSVSGPAQTVVFAFAPATGPVFTRTAQVSVDGAFSLNNIPAAAYTVWIKSDKWLAKNVSVNRPLA